MRLHRLLRASWIALQILCGASLALWTVYTTLFWLMVQLDWPTIFG